MKKEEVVSWIAQIVTAIILGQTLFFKFSAAPESIYIFETLGMEPFGRLATGVAELVAVVLLLIPRLAGLGGLLTMGILSGAILSHLTILGIEVQGDGGLLFALAVIAFIGGAVVAFIRRASIPVIGERFF
ncbi:MAG: DoxX family protein, partial [Leptospiraceae bacterium]|nr:DoxX family protein [Leptospiraceae bacterium]